LTWLKFLKINYGAGRAMKSLCGNFAAPAWAPELTVSVILLNSIQDRQIRFF
jgi:hypothetical protein